MNITGKELFQRLFVDGIQLITKLKSNMKGAVMSMSDRLLTRKRAIIETINDELKNIAQVEHSRHRSFDNFIVNMLQSAPVGRPPCASPPSRAPFPLPSPQSPHVPSPHRMAPAAPDRCSTNSLQDDTPSQPPSCKAPIPLQNFVSGW